MGPPAPSPAPVNTHTAQLSPCPGRGTFQEHPLSQLGLQPWIPSGDLGHVVGSGDLALFSVSSNPPTLSSSRPSSGMRLKDLVNSILLLCFRNRHSCDGLSPGRTRVEQVPSSQTVFKGRISLSASEGNRNDLQSRVHVLPGRQACGPDGTRDLTGTEWNQEGGRGTRVSVCPGGLYRCTVVWTHGGPGDSALPTCSRRTWVWGRGPCQGVCAHQLPSRQDWVWNLISERWEVHSGPTHPVLLSSPLTSSCRVLEP